METTERIVEAYVRYIRGWATIPNIPCPGQNEIDLLVIDPVKLARYHIETSVSVSQSFSKLTAKPFDSVAVKQRVQQASQRRTVGFFLERKFNVPAVQEKLREYGFTPNNYTKVIVTWDWTDDAAAQARDNDIQLWSFRDLLREIAERFRGSRVYLADDTLRTLHLFSHADEVPKSRPTAGSGNAGGYWIYENWTHDYAKVHRASCSFCNAGHGMHGKSTDINGTWRGPYDDLQGAFADAQAMNRATVSECQICCRR